MVEKKVDYWFFLKGAWRGHWKVVCSADLTAENLVVN